MFQNSHILGYLVTPADLCSIRDLAFFKRDFDYGDATTCSEPKKPERTP